VYTQPPHRKDIGLRSWAAVVLVPLLVSVVN